jgi:hypothetical protein
MWRFFGRDVIGKEWVKSFEKFVDGFRYNIALYIKTT